MPHTGECLPLFFSPPPPPPQVHNSKETSKGDHSLTELGSKFTIEPHPFHCSPSKHSHPVADKSAEKQLRTSAELSSSFCSPLRLKPLPRSKAEMVRSKLAHSQLQLKGSNALQRLSWGLWRHTVSFAWSLKTKAGCGRVCVNLHSPVT